MKNLLLIGLPRSGKTTFLAALWHLVESGEIATGWSLKAHDFDMKYLNEIRDKWSNCKKIERTHPNQSQEIVLNLEKISSDGKSMGKFQLLFPDISGEEFNRQWEERYSSINYFDLAKKCDGAIIFLIPDETIEPERIETAIQTFQQEAESQEAESQEAESQEAESQKIAYWNPKESCTQVKLIESLQFLESIMRNDRIQLSIVISAWDEAGDGAPQYWLKTRVPLLMQYIKNNKSFESKIFGVSALGDNLKNRKRLLEIPNPSERIIIVDEMKQSLGNDLTNVFSWMIDV